MSSLGGKHQVSAGAKGRGGRGYTQAAARGLLDLLVQGRVGPGGPPTHHLGVGGGESISDDAGDVVVRCSGTDLAGDRGPGSVGMRRRISNAATEKGLLAARELLRWNHESCHRRWELNGSLAEACVGVRVRPNCLAACREEMTKCGARATSHSGAETLRSARGRYPPGTSRRPGPAEMPRSTASSPAVSPVSRCADSCPAMRRAALPRSGDAEHRRPEHLATFLETRRPLLLLCRRQTHTARDAAQRPLGGPPLEQRPEMRAHSNYLSGDNKTAPVTAQRRPEIICLRCC